MAVRPDDLFRSLRRLAGRTYRWESSAQELPAYLKLRGVPPPGQPRVRPGGGTAGGPRTRGSTWTQGAVAAAMSPSTARGCYLAMDQEKAAAELVAKLADNRRPGTPSA